MKVRQPEMSHTVNVGKLRAWLDGVRKSPGEHGSQDAPDLPQRMSGFRWWGGSGECDGGRRSAANQPPTDLDRGCVVRAGGGFVTAPLG